MTNLEIIGFARVELLHQGQMHSLLFHVVSVNLHNTIIGQSGLHLMFPNQSNQFHRLTKDVVISAEENDGSNVQTTPTTKNGTYEDKICTFDSQKLKEWSSNIEKDLRILLETILLAIHNSEVTEKVNTEHKDDLAVRYDISQKSSKITTYSIEHFQIAPPVSSKEGISYDSCITKKYSTSDIRDEIR